MKSLKLKIKKQKLEQRLTIQLKEVQALIHKRYLAYRSEVNTKENCRIAKKLQIDSVAPAKAQVIKANRSCSSEGGTSKEATAIQSADSQGQWPKNTVLIAGDSALSSINENTLSQRYHTRVRCFKGSMIADLYDYLKPLIKKKPEKIILIVGANDLVNVSIAEMMSGKSLCSDIAAYPRLQENDLRNYKA